MSVYHYATIILAFSLLLPFYRVLKGPTIYDRLLGVATIASKTFVLICLVGFIFKRIDMFVDIALAYGLLNFAGTIVVANYLEREARPLKGDSLS